jgi:AraC-like DNA-binding protein
VTTLVRSATIAKYSEVARGVGIDPVRMLDRVGLDRSCLHMPDLRIPEASLAEVLESSASAAEGGSLGLLVGETWRLSDFGVISLLLQHQPTLRDALRELERYRHLISDSVVLNVTEHRSLAVLRINLVTDRPLPGRQPVELAVGALLSLCRFHLEPRWMPRSVHFTHPAPASVRIHLRAFGPRLEFGSEFDGIVLDRDELDHVNPASSLQMARYARQYVDLQPRGGPASIVDDVRRAVHAQLTRGGHRLEQVGATLGTSPRTLQRQLEQAGESFQSLVNDVRREQAMRYLEGRAHNVSQVAELLGFSETSVFSRWFGNQFGVPPSQWGRPRAATARESATPQTENERQRCPSRRGGADVSVSRRPSEVRAP